MCLIIGINNFNYKRNLSINKSINMKVFISILFVVISAIFQMLTPLRGYTENFILAMGSLACAALFILSHFDDKFKHYQQ